MPQKMHFFVWFLKKFLFHFAFFFSFVFHHGLCRHKSICSMLSSNFFCFLDTKQKTEKNALVQPCTTTYYKHHLAVLRVQMLYFLLVHRWRGRRITLWLLKLLQSIKKYLYNIPLRANIKTSHLSIEWTYWKPLPQ